MTPIAGISKSAYVVATRRCLDWGHDLQRAGTDDDPSMQPDRALETYWAEEAERAFAVQAASTADAAEVFKYANDLPLARIKRIMKSDEDVRMISAEAPIVFAKACEMFISDLTMRSYGFTTVRFERARGAARAPPRPFSPRPPPRARRRTRATAAP